MNVDDRSSFVKKLNLCFNCLAGTHSVKTCSSSHNCFSCRKRHNTLLHRDSPNLDNTPSKSENKARSQISKIQSTVSRPTSSSSHIAEISNSSADGLNIQTCFASNTQSVLLGTAVVQINHFGLRYFARALIDSGSQGTFVSERIFHLLKLPFQPIDVEISGLNATKSAKSRKLVNFSICPRFDSSLELYISALVVPQLSGNLPTSSINSSILEDFPSLVLADPKFYESSRVDLLLGADVFNKILLDNVKRNVCGSLVAQETIFGWIVTGPIQSNPAISSHSTIVSYLVETKLEKQLRRFWEVENFPQKTYMSHEDTLCEKLYTRTTERDKEGRYVVCLPFRQSFCEGSKQLGQSRHIAHAQLLRSEIRLSKNIELKNKYDSVIQEYLEFGHMERVTTSSADYPNHYYLPHHAVIKPESTTTKVRVVFNASCPTSSGFSLNDMLYPGPILQRDITILLLRWRFYRYVFNADIEKMYRQIKIHPNDSAFQRILFRLNPSEGIQDFELKTVTFGVNSAPYLAIRTLLQLAEDVKDSLPAASEIIEDSMYVDDVIAGAHNIQSAINAKDQLTSALSSACFPLRKWTSNCPQILEGIPKAHLLKEDFLCFDDTSHTKTLGVKWNAKSDIFMFNAKPLCNKIQYTKREVLSEIAKIYDPAGWLSPIVVLAKILMRRIWLSNVDWDDSISLECLLDWKKFLNDYSLIDSISLPRWISYSPTCCIQYHAFCDASENAYAVAIYTRVEINDNSVLVSLLTSKSRVSPVKSLSIPKLELCGATLLAEVVNSIIPHMKVTNYEIFKWTDSTIVLSWLQKPPCHWKVFVANRVSNITNKVGTKNWLHVDSKSNPADLASRGVYPQDLIHNKLWWHGPHWLSEPKSSWPTMSASHADTDLEKKATIVHFAFISNYQDVLERFSSFSRAIRVLCYVFRFLHRTHRDHRLQFVHSSELLAASEVDFVKTRLILLAQKMAFPVEYRALSKGDDISQSSKIANLNPFIDKEGLIRACGRLAYSPSMNYKERFPIILPYDCHFSRLLVQFTHILTLHGGNQLVVSLVRAQFWVHKLKNLVKTVINKCKECVIHRKKTLNQLMAPLPPERTTLHRPFHCTGIDFAGPFEIKNFAGRGCKMSKGYVCIFVCFGTKAIHLEATTSLSTPAFLAAFHRFISRRGCPLQVYSDNGTNFVGASREITRDFLAASRSNLVSQFAHQNLTWHFIPPGAPHMGGLWEAGVKSFKTHFKKVSTSFKYTFEEFSTLLSRIEACLNSRPISTPSDDHTDLNPLTPGHFLIGGPILSPPEPTLDSHSESVVNRWQRVKVLQYHFCKRWKNEYLKELHKRNKWQFPEKNIEIDSIVVIRDENLPPNEWRIGRVTKLYPGKDNRIRVADVFTQKGVLTRPIVKLVILPTQ